MLKLVTRLARTATRMLGGSKPAPAVTKIYCPRTIGAMPNGCTCAMVRSSAIEHGDPMPPGWRCIACRGRFSSDQDCRVCGVGLLSGEGRTCTSCTWATEDD